MANEKRLIDADALTDMIESTDWYHVSLRGKLVQGASDVHKAFYKADDIYKSIENAPTVDAVEVVRKPIKGYEGYYEVDQFGRVYGCDRVVHVEDNGREYDKPVKGRQLKQSLHSAGYKTVSLTRDGITKQMFVHRAVASAFIPNPDNLPMVNHKDEDKSNNFVENLEWCTAKYNSTYGTAIMRSTEKKRGVALSEKHKEDIAKSLKGYYKTHTSAAVGHISEKRKCVLGQRDGETIRFPSVKDAAVAVNGARANIARSCNSKTKTAYGYKWSWDFCSYGEKREVE